MRTVSTRLKGALQERGESIRGLHRALKEEGIRGARAYASIHAYVSGDVTEPPLDFLRAAAAYLGYRVAWLAFGDGLPTEEMQSEIERFGKVAGTRDAWERLSGRMRIALGQQEVSHIALDHVHRLTMEYVVSVGRGDEMPDGSQHEELATAVAAPIRELGHDPAELAPAKYSHYVITVAEALRYLLADEVAP